MEDSKARSEKRGAPVVVCAVCEVTGHLSSVGQKPLVHGRCSSRNTLALDRKVGTQKASAPRLKVEAVIPSVDHT